MKGAWLLAAAAALHVTLAASGRPLGLDSYMPVPEANPLTADKVAKGRRLFFDRRLSGDATVACATCHDPNRGFSDGRAIAIGIGGRRGRRSTPAIINRGYGRLFFWDGRAATLEDLVLKPIEDPNEMGSTADDAARRVGLEPRDLAASLASYVRTILSGASPFDRYAMGDTQALSKEALRGLAVFRRAGACVTCHIGPNFSDETRHNTGVAWDGDRLRDEGAGHGDFKTPTLREVARTAPYMHDGSLATLEDVVDFYDRGGRPNPNLDPAIRPLTLAPSDKAALVTFLRSLAGTIAHGVLVSTVGGSGGT